MSPIGWPSWASSCRPSPRPSRPTSRRCAPGRWVFTSGQLPCVDGTLLATGKVGARRRRRRRRRPGASLCAERPRRDRRRARGPRRGGARRQGRRLRGRASPDFTGQPGSSTAPARCSARSSATPASTRAAPSGCRACRSTRRSRSSWSCRSPKAPLRRAESTPCASSCGRRWPTGQRRSPGGRGGRADQPGGHGRPGAPCRRWRHRGVPATPASRVGLRRGCVRVPRGPGRCSRRRPAGQRMVGSEPAGLGAAVRRRRRDRSRARRCRGPRAVRGDGGAAGRLG